MAIVESVNSLDKSADNVLIKKRTLVYNLLRQAIKYFQHVDLFLGVAFFMQIREDNKLILHVVYIEVQNFLFYLFYTVKCRDLEAAVVDLDVSDFLT